MIQDEGNQKRGVCFKYGEKCGHIYLNKFYDCIVCRHEMGGRKKFWGSNPSEKGILKHLV